jgi:hypothetical protein
MGILIIGKAQRRMMSGENRNIKGYVLCTGLASNTRVWSGMYGPISLNGSVKSLCGI